MAGTHTGVQVFVLFVGCLVVAVHGWFVGAFACATILVVRGDEKASVIFCVQHLLLNTSSTYATRLNPKSAQKQSRTKP